jgi:serine/threonine protein kinase
MHSGAPDSGRLGASRSRSQPVQGRSLGPYELLRELGRGANGVVYLARHRDSADLLCALKVLTAMDTEAALRFGVEAEATARIHHPGVLRTYDVGRQGRHLYYAMEYCPGPTLRERLREGPLELEEALQVGTELARTLAAAHDAGIIHRDLKPENIILDAETGRPRVADFGLARDRELTRNLTQTGAVLGTPAYMAPEQLRGERGLDHRVDVYALGAILFESLSSRPPFVTRELIHLFTQVQHEPAPPLRKLAPHVPAGLEAVCARALAKNPADRPSSAHELAEALERARADLHAPASTWRATPLGVGAGVVLLGALGAAAVVLRAPVETVAISSPTSPLPLSPTPQPSLEERPTPSQAPQLSDSPPPLSPPPASASPAVTAAPITVGPPSPRPIRDTSPASWKELVHQGDVHFSSARYADAAAVFREATERFPAQPIPHLALGHALFGCGDFAAAASALRAGLSRLPTWPRDGRDLRRLFPGEVLSRQGKELQRAVERAPEHVDLVFLLGYVYHFCGHGERARELFARVLTLQPDDATAPLFLPR